MSRVIPDFHSGNRWAVPLRSPDHYNVHEALCYALNEEMESMWEDPATYCLRASILSSSFCLSKAPIQSSNRSQESSFRGILRRKSWRMKKGYHLACSCCVTCWCLCLNFVPSQGTYAHPATGCAPSFLHLISLKEISLLGCLSASSHNRHSKGTPFKRPQI